MLIVYKNKKVCNLKLMVESCRERETKRLQLKAKRQNSEKENVFRLVKFKYLQSKCLIGVVEKEMMMGAKMTAKQAEWPLSLGTCVLSGDLRV